MLFFGTSGCTASDIPCFRIAVGIKRRRRLRRSFRGYLSERQLNERAGGAFLLNGLDLSLRQSSLPRLWQREMARDSFARPMRPRNAITRRAILDDLRSHFWPVCIELPCGKRSRGVPIVRNLNYFSSLSWMTDFISSINLIPTAIPCEKCSIVLRSDNLPLFSLLLHFVLLSHWLS